MLRSLSVSLLLSLSLVLGFAIDKDFVQEDVAYSRPADAIPAKPLLTTAVLSPVVGVSLFVPEPTAKPTPKAPTSLHPVSLSIPAVAIDSNIQPVGVNAKGEMDVPSGRSDSVGWYKYGAKPGEIGTAVIDAHVFAAFQNLDQVKVGTDIYVKTADNTTLHFKVAKVATYKLSDLKPSMLFTNTSGKNLNLITCAGTYVASKGTYDHRLIVYTKYVGVA